MRRLATRRPKRAAQRHQSHALTEVERVIRLAPGLWTAHVTYLHGLSQWSETVRFEVVTRTESVLTVHITDSDYPTDRRHVVQVPAPCDFPAFVRTYLIAGRW